MNSSEKTSFLPTNIEALQIRGSKGIHLNDPGESAPDLEILTTPSGHPTVCLKESNGHTFHLHSAYNPPQEAQSFAASLDLADATTVVVLGFGLGYHVEQIWRDHPDLNLIVVEPNPVLFRLALEARDLSPLLQSKRVRLIVEKDTTQVAIRLMSSLEGLFHGKIQLVTHDPSLRTVQETRQEIKNTLLKIVKFILCDKATAIQFNLMYQKNTIANIPHLLKDPGLKTLFGKFKNRPAICVSSGPSLDKNIHLLQQAKGRALIVCMGQSLQILRRNNIEPDLIVTIDPEEINCSCFEGLGEKSRDMVLVYAPQTTPQVIQDFKGLRFPFYNEKPLLRWMKNATGDLGNIPSGSSVAHTALWVSEALGASPIVLIGQDLSFSTSTHSKDSFETQPVHLGKTKDGEQMIVYQKGKGKWSAEPALFVKGNYQDRVPTNPVMLSFLTLFEEILKDVKVPCINATEGGAFIRGTQVMSLQNVLDTYCRDSFAIEPTLNEARHNPPKGHIAPFRDEVKTLIDRLKKIQKNSERGRTCVKELLERLKSQPQMDQTCAQLAEESNRLKDENLKLVGEFKPIFNENMLPYIYMTDSKQTKKFTPDQSKEKLINQIERVELYHTGFCVNTKELIDAFEKILPQI